MTYNTEREKKMSKGNFRKIKICILFLLSFVCFMINWNSVQAASNANYHYEIYRDKILKINLRTGKVTQTKIKSGADCGTDMYRVTEYKGFLYFTIDTFPGTSEDWEYVCRVKKDGKGFKVLGKGKSPLIVKNKIYYTQFGFQENVDNSNWSVKGIYRMELDGSKKKRIMKNYELFAAYNNKLYARPISNTYYGEIVKCSLKGKVEKTIVKKTDSAISHEEMYISDGTLYCDNTKWNNLTHSPEYKYMAINLKNGKARSYKSKGYFVGIDKKNLFYYVPSYAKDIFYYQGKGSGKIRTFGIESQSPTIRSYSDKPYVVVKGYKKNYEIKNLVIINLKKGTAKKIAGL